MNNTPAASLKDPKKSPEEIIIDYYVKRGVPRFYAEILLKIKIGEIRFKDREALTMRERYDLVDLLKWQCGKSLIQIADILGCTKQNVSFYLQKIRIDHGKTLQGEDFRTRLGELRKTAERAKQGALLIGDMATYWRVEKELNEILADMGINPVAPKEANLHLSGDLQVVHKLVDAAKNNPAIKDNIRNLAEAIRLGRSNANSDPASN